MESIVEKRNFNEIFKSDNHYFYTQFTKEFIYIYTNLYLFVRKKSELDTKEKRLLQAKTFSLLLMKLNLISDSKEETYNSYQEDILYEGVLIDFESLIAQLYSNYQNEKKTKASCNIEVLFDYKAFLDEKEFYTIDDEEIKVAFICHKNEIKLITMNIYANDEFITKDFSLLDIEKDALNEKTLYFIFLMYINLHRLTSTDGYSNFSLNDSFLVQQADILQKNISI